jgi:hypothetical protein
MAVPAPARWVIQPAVPVITRATARYIAHHRARLFPKAVPISPQIQAALRDFFPQAVLEETRVIKATVPNPRFYSLVKILGITGVLEMSAIGAITLIDVIAYPHDMSRATLFHELVHAVQYRGLGLRQFARLYVRGFLENGGYDGIPLELQAYELEERFSGNPKSGFSVEEDVMRRLQAGLL